jgi:hypothetical protein
MTKIKFDESKPVAVTIGPDVKFAWPHLHEKYAFEGDEDYPFYQVTVLIPKTNTTAIDRINNAIDEAIERGFSGKLSQVRTFKKGTKESSLTVPLKDGDEKEDNNYSDVFAGHYYLRLKTDRRPTVLDANGQEILDPDDFYSGVIGAASITFAPYNFQAMTQGVKAYINHAMKLKDGPRIGGAAISVDEAFTEYITPGTTSIRSRFRGSEDDMLG